MAGRPRSPGLDAALTEATAALLAERGYAATTVDAVAARAGVPKSALYRRWSSKAELVFAAVVHREEITVADTGALGTDLLDLVRRILAALDRPAARHALPGLLTDLAGDPQAMRRFQDGVIGPERRLVAVVADRAIARGELTPPVDVVGLHAQLLGTAFAWTVLLNDTAPPDLAERVAAAALAALTTATLTTEESP